MGSQGSRVETRPGSCALLVKVLAFHPQILADCETRYRRQGEECGRRVAVCASASDYFR